MAKHENPPFPRGTTFYGISPLPAIDTSSSSVNLGGQNFEGNEYEFEDINLAATTFSPGAKPTRTGQPVTCRVVRNISGIALLPCRLAHLATTGYVAAGGNFGTQVDGYATTTAEGPSYPIDEWLTSAGAPNNDLFYIVTKGPACVLTDIAALDSSTTNPTLIAIGNILVSLTAATSQATTAGRAEVQSLAGATAVLGGNIQNRIGRAISAATTTQTNTRVLVEVTKW